MNDTPAGLCSDLDVLAFVLAERAAGRPAALATIVALDGPFSRPLGAQIGIAADGRFAGSISGGCLENAVVGEGVAALAAGAPRRLRYGRGSPFLDVRLPCGGGLDVLVDPDPHPDVLTEAMGCAARREPFMLALGSGSAAVGMRLATADDMASPELFLRRYRPTARLVLAGRGWEIVALSRLAVQSGFEVMVASQEAATLEACGDAALQTFRLTTPDHAPALPLDADTALACLFHEHEWETAILAAALRSPSFYIGALGSRATHARRVEALKEQGIDEPAIARIRAPIGVFAARDPRRLAVSALAEILSVREELERAAA